MSEKKQGDLSDLFSTINTIKAGMLDMGMDEALKVFSMDFIGHPERWNDQLKAIIMRGLRALQG